MSALSDFLTQATAPWWGVGVIGVAGTLLGTGLNAWWNKKRDAAEAERRKAETDARNAREDALRWDMEIRDGCVAIDSAIEKLNFRWDFFDAPGADHGDMLNRSTSDLKGISDTATRLLFMVPAGRLRSTLESIFVSANVAYLSAEIEWDGPTVKELIDGLRLRRNDLESAVREHLRIQLPDAQTGKT